MNAVSNVNYPVRVASEEYFVSTRIKKGGNRLLFLVHGIGDSKDDFHGIWELPSFSHFSICAIDLIGFGESSKPVSFSYDLAEQAAACAQVIEQLGTGDVSIIGHSVGGAVAVLLAKSISSKLAALLSVEGNLIAEDCGIITRKTAALSPESFESTFFPDLVERIRAEGRPKDVIDLQRCSPMGFYSTARSAVEWSDSGELLKIFEKLPVSKAYIYGDKSSEYPVLRKLDAIPKLCIASSGHNPMDDNPKDFYETCARFLEEAS